MKLQPLVVSTALMVATFSLLSVTPAHAVDRAIVVGVNNYPRLVNATLRGSVPDARLVGSILKEKYGFATTVLTDAQATRQGIINALKSVGNTDRFVFYFAGHGEAVPQRGAIILPHDAMENSDQNDLSARELNNLVSAVPAKSHTVLLDSCFSGAMMRSLQRLVGTKRQNLRFRYHDRSASRALRASSQKLRGKDLVMRSKDLVIRAKDLVLRKDPNHADDNGHLEDSKTSSDAGRVCYFTASRQNERAGEDSFKGEFHGVFTYFLAERLIGAKEKWGAVQPTISRKVSDHMEDLQHPTLSGSFIDALIFDGKGILQPSKPQETFWDYCHADNPNRSKIELIIFPRSTKVTVGERVNFSVTVGDAGYLILLERGTSGKVNLLFPESQDIEEARTEAGKVQRIPEEGYHFEAESPGSERLRAFLFTSRDAAEELLNSFPKSRSITRGGLQKDLIKKPTPRTEAESDRTFYTSDIIFEVVEETPGKK